MRSPKLCPACTKKLRRYNASLQRRVYEERKSASACVRCGGKRIVGLSLCGPCRDDGARRAREHYAKNRSPKGTTRCGLCSKTGHNARRCPTHPQRENSEAPEQRSENGEPK